MDFFTAIENRRSVRHFRADVVPTEVIEKALDAALLAPNSSNMQTSRIYWVRSSEKKARLVKACLNQGAARTAPELLVFTADRSSWRVAQRDIVRKLEGNPRTDLHAYYKKIVPLSYGYVWLAPIKWLYMNVTGLFRPSPRHPWSAKDIEGICVKSCALACDHFMLAVSAQGYDTCPMEGFDEWRVRRILGLNCRTRVVMVISVGHREPRGVWGERVRLQKSEVVFEV